MRREHHRSLPRQGGQLGVEKLLPFAVEARIRLVEQEQLGLVQKRAAEREPLLHAAGEGPYPLAAGIPEPVPLQQHADALAALGDVVETPVEVEVLERAQLPIDEWLVSQIADLTPIDGDLELTPGGHQEARTEGKERRLARSVRAGDQQDVALRDVEVEVAEHALRPEAPAEAARRDHTTTSASTNRKNVTLMTPFIVKKAMSRRLVSRGETSECS